MKLSWKNSLLILLGIIFIGGFLRIHKLDNQSLVADEYIGANISYGYNQSGKWKFWDWNNQELTDNDYTRGQIYYWQSAKVLDFLSPTEFNFRLVSVLWGIIGIALVFFAAYFYSNNFVVALVSAFLWAISISSIRYDRHFRMYSMFTPVYLALTIFIYQFLESKSKASNFIGKISQKTSLNWFYFFPALFFLVISFATHFLTINIFSTIGIYILFFAIYELKKQKSIINKYFILLLIPIISLISLTVTGLIFKASGFIGFMENNWGHWDNIMTNYSHWLVVITFFIFGLYYLIKNNLKKGLWLSLSFLVPFLSAVFIWDRVAGSQYIYFIQTFETIIISAGICFIAIKLVNTILPKKWYEFFNKNNYKKAVLQIGLIVYSIVLIYNFQFFSGNEHFYGEKTKWDKSNYKEVFSYYLRHREKDALLVTRNFRNYYYADAGIPVFDFGGEHQPEKKLTLEKMTELESEGKPIWIVIDANDHDYIRGSARDYIKTNYESIETKYTKDSMEIWKRLSNN